MQNYKIDHCRRLYIQYFSAIPVLLFPAIGFSWKLYPDFSWSRLHHSATEPGSQCQVIFRIFFFEMIKYDHQPLQRKRQILKQF